MRRPWGFQVADLCSSVLQEINALPVNQIASQGRDTRPVNQGRASCMLQEVVSPPQCAVCAVPCAVCVLCCVLWVWYVLCCACGVCCAVCALCCAVLTPKGVWCCKPAANHSQAGGGGSIPTIHCTVREAGPLEREAARAGVFPTAPSPSGTARSPGPCQLGLELSSGCVFRSTGGARDWSARRQNTQCECHHNACTDLRLLPNLEPSQSNLALTPTRSFSNPYLIPPSICPRLSTCFHRTICRALAIPIVEAMLTV